MFNDDAYRWQAQMARDKALGAVKPLDKALW